MHESCTFEVNNCIAFIYKRLVFVIGIDQFDGYIQTFVLIRNDAIYYLI